MGFTALGGLAMATRRRDLDPGVVLYAQEHLNLSTAHVRHALEWGSGLLGMAGTSDMREIETHADLGSDRATLGLAVYLHRLRAGIAALATSKNGLDAIVFAGGGGEQVRTIRSAACHGLGFIGVHLDEKANQQHHDGRLSNRTDSPVAAAIVETREALQFAHEVRSLNPLQGR